MRIDAPTLSPSNLGRLCAQALDYVRDVDLQGKKPSTAQGHLPEPGDSTAAEDHKMLAKDRDDVRVASSYLVAIYRAFERLPEVASLYPQPARAAPAAPVDRVDPKVLKTHLEWLLKQKAVLARPEVHEHAQDQGRIMIETLLAPLLAAQARTVTPAGPGPGR